MSQTSLRSLHPSQLPDKQRPLARIGWRLFILFFPLAGPFLAPLFTRIGIWPFNMIASFVYFLGNTICPLPQRALMIGIYSTAVCPLCYGALLGLATILLSFPYRPKLRQHWESLPWLLRSVLITCALIPWLGDYVVNRTGWVFTPLWEMYLLGLPGGFAVGLLAYFVMGREAE